MKIAAATLTLFASASAFSPSSTQSRQTAVSATADLTGLVGTDIENGNKIFDPVGLAQWAPVDYLRKAELSNGRAAMLATVGWVWPKFVGTFDSNDVSTTDPIDAIMQADPQWWAQFILLCGTIEAIKYRGEQEGKSYTGEGDAVIDYLKQWNKLSAPEKEKMRLKELKNGRLAMIGFAGFLANHFIPGSVPGLPEGF
ncbi:hypothetical protein MPSEU_000008500 [Mayamaea pseudoterrestris]|nr:hypothetical protein MPSEU_000008500 [Mayamaea pseudoterrestris]